MSDLERANDLWQEIMMRNGQWLRNQLPPSFPKIVTLCGSTRFSGAYIHVNRELTLKGYIVISVGLFGHEEKIDMNGEVKKMLDNLHLRKIDLADAVYIVNVGGYIGESTKREIEYAKSHGKEIMYLEEVK